MAKKQKLFYKNIVANMSPIETITVALKGAIYEGAEVTIKHRLTMVELTALMNDIVNTIVDYKEGIFNPEYADTVQQIFILQHYAGIAIGKSELPYAYRVLTETDLYEQVVEHIDDAQLAELAVTVDERIAYLRDMIVSTASHQVVGMLAQMEQMTGELQGMSNELNGEKMQELVAALNTLGSVANMPEGLPEPEGATPEILMTEVEAE